MRFSWDEDKALTNLRDHEVSFEEAEAVFDDPLAIDIPDDRFKEARFSIYGEAKPGRLLVVAYTMRGNTIHIITAREMEPKEKRKYANRPRQ